MLAPVHVGKGNLGYIDSSFPGRLISRNSDYPYPARSPDLTPLDAFLWGMLKEKVFWDPVPKNTTAAKSQCHPCYYQYKGGQSSNDC